MMVYDNTKLKRVFDLWLAQNCEIKFGTTYTASLLADFNDFAVTKKKMLKGSPGPVPFGKLMREAGFATSRVDGQTHWQGIVLKNPIMVAPRMYKKTKRRMEAAARRREAVAKRIRKSVLPTEAQKKARLARQLKEMEKETKERAKSAALLKPVEENSK